MALEFNCFKMTDPNVQLGTSHLFHDTISLSGLLPLRLWRQQQAHQVDFSNMEFHEGTILFCKRAILFISSQLTETLRAVTN